MHSITYLITIYQISGIMHNIEIFRIEVPKKKLITGNEKKRKEKKRKEKKMEAHGKKYEDACT